MTSGATVTHVRTAVIMTCNYGSYGARITTFLHASDGERAATICDTGLGSPPFCMHLLVLSGTGTCQ